MVKGTPTASPAEGMVRLHHDEARSCSYDGHSYLADERGDVLVPAAAAAALAAHGFAVVAIETGAGGA